MLVLFAPPRLLVTSRRAVVVTGS